MKKTSRIQLVLITAAFASCGRVIIPDQPADGYNPDPSLTATPYYSDDRYDCDCRVDTPFLYRRGAYWHNHTFIVRGGFGKAAASTAS